MVLSAIPIVCLNDLRLEKASELLADPDCFLQINEIGPQAGLLNDGHFTSSFKAKFGMTPTEFGEYGATCNPMRLKLASKWFSSGIGFIQLRDFINLCLVAAGLLFTCAVGQEQNSVAISRAQKNDELAERRKVALSRLEQIVSDYRIAVDERQFREIPRQVKTIGSAIAIIWEHEPGNARSSFRKLFSKLSSAYIEHFDSVGEPRVYIKQSVRILVGIIATKDKEEAARLLSEFYQTELGLLSQMNEGERLQLAEDFLSIDVDRSTKIAETVVLKSLPQRSVNYFSKLKSTSISAHDDLIRKVFSVVSSGAILGFHDELVLESYIFKEVYIAFPVSKQSDIPGMDKFPFPVGGVEVNESGAFNGHAVDPNEVRAYLLASLSGLEQQPRQGHSLSAIQSAGAYFITAKIGTYIEMYSDHLPAIQPRFSGLFDTIGAAAIGNGLMPDNLAHLKLMAQTAVSKYFGNAVADIADDGAQKSQDSFAAARNLENRILRLISNKSFKDAEKLIFSVKDIRTNEALSDFLNYSIIFHHANGKEEIESVQYRLDLIKDRNVKILAIFQLVRFLLKNNEKGSAGHYIQKAKGIIFDNLDTYEIPQMIVALSGLELEYDSQNLTTIMLGVSFALTSRKVEGPETVKRPDIYALNYRGDSVILFSQRVAGGGIRYEMDGTGIDVVFSRAANVDWNESLMASEAIEDKYLRSRAVLAVCSLALRP